MKTDVVANHVSFHFFPPEIISLSHFDKSRDWAVGVGDAVFTRPN